MARVEIIAEVASNHGGNLDLAIEFIQQFAVSGADTIKFQHINPLHLRAGDPQTVWFNRCAFTEEEWWHLRAACARENVGFLLTAFHALDVPMVRALSDRMKVGSGEAGEQSLAKAIHKARFDEVIVSHGLTGEMLNYGAPTVRLGCVTRYPAPSGIAYAALCNDPSLDGWSDHAVGLDECKAAIVAGAKVIETHVQLPNQARPPRAFEKTVDQIRELREFTDEDAEAKFVGRWQA